MLNKKWSKILKHGHENLQQILFVVGDGVFNLLWQKNRGAGFVVGDQWCSWEYGIKCVLLLAKYLLSPLGYLLGDNFFIHSIMGVGNYI